MKLHAGTLAASGGGNLYSCEFQEKESEDIMIGQLIEGDNFIILNIDPESPSFYKSPISLSTLHTVCGVISKDKVERIPISYEPLSRIAVLANNLIYELPNKNIREELQASYYENYHVVLNAIQRLRLNYLHKFDGIDVLQIVQQEYENVEITHDLLNSLEKLIPLDGSKFKNDVEECRNTLGELDKTYPLFALRNIRNHAKLLDSNMLKNIKVSDSRSFDFRKKIFENIQEDKTDILVYYYEPPKNNVLSAGRNELAISKDFLFKAILKYKAALRRFEKKIIASKIILTELITNQYHLADSGKTKVIRTDGREVPATSCLLMIHGIIGVPLYEYQRIEEDD